MIISFLRCCLFIVFNSTITKTKSMIKKHILFLVFISLLGIIKPEVLMSQSMDTLTLAKVLSKQSENDKSVNLLKTYYKKHSKDLYAGWLYADALYKNKDYKKASQVYNETIKNNPQNIDLRLDYAMKSTEIGMLEEAFFHLNKMKNNIPKDYKFAVKKTIAKIYYWQGEYERALSNINMALSIYDNDKESLKLKADIIRIRSNWMKIDASYLDNNQPLTRMTPNVEMGFYHNSRFSTGINVKTSFYSKDYKLYNGGEITGKVIYRLLKYKTSLELGLGLIKLPSNTYSLGTSFEVNKNLFKYTTLQAKYQYSPYLATTASVDKEVMQNNFGVSIMRNKTNSWMGKLSFDLYSFPSFDNSYYSVSSWVVSPTLKLLKFNFNLGYGFNYSDSKNNSFNSNMSLEELLSQKDTAIIINGAYDPFFSPENQKIHSLIGMISYKPSKKINIGININYGVIASADTPYLFLDNGEDGDLQIKRNYFNSDYNPIELNGYVSYELKNEVSVKAYFNYQKTNYFTSYLTGLTTKFLF